jgi:large subunit ribosomal protein L1
LPPNWLAEKVEGGRFLDFGAVLDEILRAKPSSSTGSYLKVVVSMTGPGVPVDLAVTGNFTEA